MNVPLEHAAFSIGELPTVANMTPAPLAPWECAGRRYAVVMLFCRDSQGVASLVLTRRSLLVRTHKGQVSLPGGKAEPEDLTPGDTALRELQEELGIPKKEVMIHGMIAPVQALDRSPVYTVIGSTQFPADRLEPSDDEVAQVFLVPWRLLQKQYSTPLRFKLFGSWRESHLFDFKGNRIWGLTASLIYRAGFG